jgi:holo-[acyl-carrier protein] synthase
MTTGASGVDTTGLGGLLLGLDLTEVDRVAAILERRGERFLARIFRPGEIRRQRRHPRAFAEHVAGRFAAKEAAMKALGLGWRGLAFREIEVGRDERGKPRLTFHGRALERARALEVRLAEVSITHGRDVAAAVVALLTRGSAAAPLG